jgi:uncharacterized membrane protein YccC
MAVMLRALALRPPWPYVGEVLRSLLGVLLALALALDVSPDAATGVVAAGVSAAIAGAVALQDSPRSRLVSVLLVTVAMGVAALVGAGLVVHGAVLLPVTVLWCLAAGMVWAVGAGAGLVAASTCVLVVTLPAMGHAASDAPVAALLAVFGGLTQVLLVAAWPRQRWKGQHRTLGEAYGWLASGARRLAIDADTVLDPAPLIELREAATLTDQQARRRPPAHRGLYGLPERIAMTLNALHPHAGTSAARAVLIATADALQAISGVPGRDQTARTDAALALQRLADSSAALTGDAASVAARLREQVGEACAVHFAASAPSGSVGAVRAAIAEQWHRDSPIARHAGRLAAAVAVGTIIALATGVQNGYWIALTVLLVLRPETAHTYTRCAARVAGCIGGVVAATVVTVFLEPSVTVCALLAVLGVGVAYAVAGLGFVPLSAALTAAMVFLVDQPGTTDGTTLGQRLVAVLIGGGLAVSSHVVLPDRSLVRLRQRAGELLRAEIDYAATVIRAFVHPLDHADDTLAAVWDRATRARSAFEAASGTVRAEAAAVRRWLMAYRTALNAITGVCVTLEEHMAATPPSLDPRFVVAVDDYVDALRGEVPQAGQPWTIDAHHLREAAQQLREAAGLLGKEDTAQRVLVAELEAVTRHLLNVAELSPR